MSRAVFLVPVVHEREHRFGLMNREHRPVGDDDELLVRHDRGRFSMMESDSGFRPVISRSIQIRLSLLGMGWRHRDSKSCGGV